MLQIKNISKKYVTGTLTQNALQDVSLNFRDNEFVAVLGPSGSGKTTLLNIIGGLDRYDSGDLIINDISTKKYKDRDWDSYRNHTIGFVFQSYNLIPHQSVLSNVELALTISGISKKERKERAVNALKQVGLGEQLHKKPNQMSGGQMQRVAIARALVNNPSILLADEPTGALDTDTSVQVMELLKDVAKDRLVIMVTHNPELAAEYATRTVKLRDGKITDDSDPFVVDKKHADNAGHKNMGRSSMSLLTSLSLSFNNLRAKKARTILTSFAGSIGIIGIALILSLSNGVNTYIQDIQRETMTSYPISISQETFDFASIMGPGAGNKDEAAEEDHGRDAIYSNSIGLKMANEVTSSLTKNNLTEFKKYLDDPDSEINKYLGENGIIYSYDVPFGIYSRDETGKLIDANYNAFSMEAIKPTVPGALGDVQKTMLGNMSSMVKSTSGNMVSSDVFDELLPGKDDNLVSKVTTDSYDVLAGNWPESYDEAVLVLDRNNEVPTAALYSLGMLPDGEYENIMDAINSGEKLDIKTYSWNYDDIFDKTFYLIPTCDNYEENDKGTFDYIADDKLKLENLADKGVKIKISGIIRPKEDDDSNADITGAVAYTHALTQHIIDYANNSEIVKAQKNSPDVNVLNDMRFEPDDDKEKIKDTKEYISSMGISDKASMYSSIAAMMYMNNPQQMASMATMDETMLAGMMDQFLSSPDDETLLMIYDQYISPGTYDENMKTFGYISTDAPSSISIYADTFEAKDSIADCIKKYNETADEKDKIVYTDFVAMMTSSITTIINTISYVLIAFVAVSLIVSSIMIGIITYISVLERTKEIGILRAIGASKRNISQVFNAETFIIGLLSGLLGVGISRLILIPGNAIIHSILYTDTVNAILPLKAAIILILLSIILTLIGGLIPSKKASRKDPVTALRSE